MKTMYKEEVVRKKLPVVLGMFATLTAVIFLSDLVEKIEIANRSIGMVTNPIFMLLMVFMIIYGVTKCKVKYRYSIIADQLIVHRITNGEHVVVENIELKDILFIGKTCDLKAKLEIKSTRSHACSTFGFRTYCCVYRDGNTLKKFYFQPSESFVNKASHLIDNEKRRVS